jgi:hypothetical protein
MKKLLIGLGLLGAAISIGGLAVISPGPVFKRQTVDAEPKLAYGRTIAESGKQPVAEPAPTSDVPKKADLQSPGLETEPSAPESPSDSWEARIITDETGVTVLQHGSETETVVAPGDDPQVMSAVPENGYDPEATPTQNGGEVPEITGALPQEAQAEWVQIVISGAEVQATAADDAPMLFAFPYGRRLQVISRQEGWVQVSDPHSKATGWIKTAYLAPVGAPGVPQANGDAYQGPYDYEPRERRGGWLRRQSEGMAGMVQRALSGW